MAVVGAGLVGLSTAWFLQGHGIEVTVFERSRVAAGASFGNAGWITPALAAPLPDPAILREGLRAITRRSSAVHIPLPPGPGLAAFLASFARHCTAPRWERGLAALAPLSGHALAAFDALAAGGVEAATVAGQPVVAAYASAARRVPLMTELAHISRVAGQPVEFEVLDGPAVRAAEPVLTDAASAAVRIHGQRYLDPGSFVHALAASVRLRGGDILEHTGVTGLHDDGTAVRVAGGAGERGYDAVVLATGAWLGDLARAAGVRVRVQSGRGYSFSVPVRRLPAGPVYLPGQRLACTPMPDGALRVAGVMDFRAPEAPLDRGRVAAMAADLQVMLAGTDAARRTAEWAGARPCTPDGLPIIGRTGSPRVFVAGGHGMWGITLGPVTGRLVARAVATGGTAAELAPFDPLR